MLDIVIYFFLKYSYIIAALLFSIKTFLFFKNKNKNWTVVEFLYFKPTNIQFSSDADRAKLKRVQNQLSIAIIVFLIIQAAVAILF